MEIIVDAFIEIPKNSSHIYSYNNETKQIYLDGVLPSDLVSPVEYGFIADDLNENSNPVNIIILMDKPTFPACIIESRVLGMLDIEYGDVNKSVLVAVPVRDYNYMDIKTIDDINADTKKEIEVFCSQYKTFKNDSITINSWSDIDSAIDKLSSSNKFK